MMQIIVTPASVVSTIEMLENGTAEVSFLTKVASVTVYISILVIVETFWIVVTETPSQVP